MNERIVLASFGPFLITAYSLCVSIGSLLAVLAVLWLGVRRRLALKTLLNMIICAVVGALLGARILYCAAMFDTISVDFGLDFIPRFWEGGYTLFGGVLGGLAAVCLYARVSKISVAALLDVAASGAALFLAVARLAEYFTTQGLGQYIEAETWQRFPFAVPDSYGYWAMPVFLYEAFAALVIMFVCAATLRRARPGRAAVLFLALLSLTQILLDSWRMDEFIRFGFVHLNQVAGAALLAVLLIRGVALAVKQHGRSAWQSVRCVLFALCLGTLIWVEFALDKSSIDNVILYGIMTLALIAMGAAVLYDGRLAFVGTTSANRHP
jgi:phosphatidylglycerol:prolipoprotein diacylglycerol transferase